MKSFRKSFAKSVGKTFTSRYTLVFVNGFLLASLLYFYSEDSYEKKLFEALASYVKDETPRTKNNEEALLLNSLHLTYSLGKNRAGIFANKEINTLKASLIHPVTYDLMTTNGACGSYAYILSRLLNELKIPNRIAQMKVDGLYGGHILVEAKMAKGWVVLDGSYDLYFKRANGSLASFDDVKNNWDYYKSQVPADYNYHYAYNDVRYTNWDKIPVVMPVIKGFLTLAVGKEIANNFSFRTYALRKFHILFEATIFIYLLIFLFIFRRYLQTNREKLTRFLPFTFPRRKPLLVISGNAERKVA
ncbi:hypothetical protein [Niastella vici]|uniref:hypothetical protein n=1 Tax=Niastella vici TaxID=1703345 RepID=UPI00117CB76D|nr:hypothetical protein [Niastella vici]